MQTGVLLRSVVPCLKASNCGKALPVRVLSKAACRSAFFGTSSARQPCIHKSNCTPGRKAGVATMSLFGGATVTKDSIYDFSVKDIDGRGVDFKKYAGKVLLFVNLASQCGFTPQYKELGELYDRYSSKGLVVLGFPCNQFGGQEPGSNAQVKAFAQQRGAKFPLFSKVDVNGKNAEPLYDFLKAKQSGFLVSDIKWNFTKFLVDREGNVLKRYGSSTTPLQIEEDIKKLL